MSCVHKYSEDLHICGYWVDLGADRARLRPRPAGARRPRQARSSSASTRTASRSRFEEAVAKAGAADCDRPPAHRQGRRRGPRPRPVLRGVPGARARRRSSPRKLAERRGGGRADPRRRRRRRRRPSLLGRQGARAGPRPGREPRARRRPRRHRDLLPAAHDRAQTKHCLELCEEFGLVPTASSDFHGPTHKTFSPFGRLRHLRARRAAGAGQAVAARARAADSPATPLRPGFTGLSSPLVRSPKRRPQREEHHERMTGSSFGASGSLALAGGHPSPSATALAWGRPAPESGGQATEADQVRGRWVAPTATPERLGRPRGQHDCSRPSQQQYRYRGVKEGKRMIDRARTCTHRTKTDPRRADHRRCMTLIPCDGKPREVTAPAAHAQDWERPPSRTAASGT